jgi:hypothetical protein
MDDQGLATRQIGQNVFRAASQGNDPLSCQALCHPFWKRPAKIRPPDVGMRDDLALHDGEQSAANRLDFG